MLFTKQHSMNEWNRANKQQQQQQIQDNIDEQVSETWTTNHDNHGNKWKMDGCQGKQGQRQTSHIQSALNENSETQMETRRPGPTNHLASQTTNNHSLMVSQNIGKTGKTPPARSFQICKQFKVPSNQVPRKQKQNFPAFGIENIRFFVCPTLKSYPKKGYIIKRGRAIEDTRLIDPKTRLS